jgi:serine phosphatase RsbU (regulator of sigma subunit)
VRIDARQIGTLFETPARLVSAESRDELVQAVSYALRSLFPDLDGFAVYLADVQGRFSLLSRTCTGSGTLRPSSPGFLGPAGLPDAWPDASPGMAKHGVRRGSFMSAPMLNGPAALGLITVEGRPGRAFTSIDLRLLEGVAGVLGLALQRLQARRAEQIRTSADLDRRSAAHVQRRLMSRSLPADAGVSVDVQYLPALEVGGDFYEFSYLGDGHVGAAIGDVSGKGVSAALIMSRVSSDVRRAIRTGVGPSAVLREVAATLTDIEAETFVTASCISLDARRRCLTVANAGHLPLLVRRAGGEVFDFGPASGTPLGVMTCDYTEDRIQLEQDDIVLLMTDGLVDALDAWGGTAGTTVLRSIVEAAPHDPKAINARIVEAANAGSSSLPPDDVTLVAFQLAHA